MKRRPEGTGAASRSTVGGDGAATADGKSSEVSGALHCIAPENGLDHDSGPPVPGRDGFCSKLRR